MLSLTCKTAIKAVIFLASKSKSDEKSGIAEIADFINASKHSVGKLLQTLVKGEIINSTKGPGGGFYITEVQKNFPVIAIVETIDGKEVFNGCGLGLIQCSSTHPCPIHNQYKIVKDLFEKLCRDNKIGDLCEPVNKGLAYLVG